MEIKDISEQLTLIYQEAYKHYKERTEIICNRDASSEEVEYLLDYMLDFCGDEKFLQLFKRICRQYYVKYPQMITFEINSYKEQYDEDKEAYDDQL